MVVRDKLSYVSLMKAARRIFGYVHSDLPLTQVCICRPTHDFCMYNLNELVSQLLHLLYLYDASCNIQVILSCYSSLGHIFQICYQSGLQNKKVGNLKLIKKKLINPIILF